MNSVSEKLQDIKHPLVSAMYIIKDEEDGHKMEDVLVIETSFSRKGQTVTSFDSCLMDLLFDLEDLKNEAETKGGRFSRVDICTN